MCVRVYAIQPARVIMLAHFPPMYEECTQPDVLLVWQASLHGGAPAAAAKLLRRPQTHWQLRRRPCAPRRAAPHHRPARKGAVHYEPAHSQVIMRSDERAGSISEQNRSNFASQCAARCIVADNARAVCNHATAQQSSSYTTYLHGARRSACPRAHQRLQRSHLAPL